MNIYNCLIVNIYLQVNFFCYTSYLSESLISLQGSIFYEFSLIFLLVQLYWQILSVFVWKYLYFTFKFEGYFHWEFEL